MVFGKNTMIRKCIRNMCEDGEHPEWESIIPVMRGNLGFIFTNCDLDEILDIIKDFVKPAAAKAGVIAPCSCTIPKGPTGLDPAQTSFFQALNIATKINKGSIEIINDCTVIKEGVKVGSSEAALLTKLNIKPFTYGLAVKYIYEGGVFSPDVLKITDDILIGKMMMGIGQVQALSIGASFLTAASLAPTIANGFANVLAVALEADYLEFEQVQKVKEFLDNPDAFVCAAPTTWSSSRCKRSRSFSTTRTPSSAQRRRAAAAGAAALLPLLLRRPRRRNRSRSRRRRKRRWASICSINCRPYVSPALAWPWAKRARSGVLAVR